MAPQQPTSGGSSSLKTGLTHSDVHSLLSIITMRLGERNFIKWSFQFRSTLGGNGLFGYFDGTEVTPPRYALTSEGTVTDEETEAYKSWKQTDMALLSLLMATLEEDIVDVIIGCSTSRQAWLALQERFSAVSRGSVMQLKTELQTLRKGNESIEKYLQRVKNARDQLLSVGVNIPDEDIIIVILNGLPDEFSTVRTVIEGRETPISLRDLRSQLLSAERRIEGNFSVLSNMSAMAARNHNGTKDGSKGWHNSRSDGKSREDNKYSGKGNMECSVCGKRGHTVDTCFRVHKCQICGKHGHLTSTCYQNPDYNPKQQSQQQQSVPTQSNGSQNNGPTLECQICSKKGHTAANCFYRTDVPGGHPSLSIPTCQICGIKGHVALNCSHRTHFAYQGSDPPSTLTALSAQSPASGNTIFHHNHGGGSYSITHGSASTSFLGGFHPSTGASSSSSQPDNEVWIGDSGATHHMTSELRNLSIAQPYMSDNKITVGNGAGLNITHTGSSYIKPADHVLQLKQVLRVPDLAVNLLSFTKLCRDNNCFITLDEFDIYVQDKASRKILYQGKSSEEGLFLFNTPSISTIGSASPSAFVSSTSSSFQVWHQRLGHPSQRSVPCRIPDGGGIDESSSCSFRNK